ncbi:Uncharacterised protein [Mycobacteroides abscessus subsp. abscessus]|nr:Uncharacterised protein [Mycobacteroides abscessus subsp. abscessus]
MARKAAPPAMGPVMISTQNGVLQAASSAVSPIQKAAAPANSQPSRSAQRRLRSSRARGSAAAPRRRATRSDNSAAVSMLRCRTACQPRVSPGRPADWAFTAAPSHLESYCDSGFSGAGLAAGAAGVAGAAAPPEGRELPCIEARICSRRECPAICTLACWTSIMRP